VRYMGTVGANMQYRREGRRRHNGLKRPMGQKMLDAGLRAENPIPTKGLEREPPHDKTTPGVEPYLGRRRMNDERSKSSEKNLNNTHRGGSSADECASVPAVMRYPEICVKQKGALVILVRLEKD